MERGHQRLASSASRRSSISSLSDDDLGRPRRIGTHGRARAPSQQHFLSPGLSDHPQTPGTPDFQSQKGLTNNSYEYERASLAELPPRPQRKSLITRTVTQPTLLKWFRQKYWATEALALLASLILFAILIGLLYRYNRTPLLAWTFPVTLNAIISAIVQALALCLVVPVSSCLGQLKWNRFRRHGGFLREFDLHDQASRTAWGSVKLIFKKPKQVHGALLAFATIAINIIAPFLQQIVSVASEATFYPYNASVPVSYSYIETGDPTAPVDQLTQFAINQGLFSLYPGGFSVYPNVGWNQNATWNRAYATLGVVSQCEDISDKLTKKDVVTQNDPTNFFKTKSFDLALPNGHTFKDTVKPYAFQANASTLGMFDISSDKDSIVFKDKGNVLVDFTAIYVPPLSRNSSGDVIPLALECIFQFAGFPFTARMTAGANDPGPFIETWSHDTYVVDNSEAAQKASPWLYRLGGPANTAPTTQGGTATCINMTVPTDPGNPGNLATCFTSTSKLATYLSSLFQGHVTTTAAPDYILRNDSQASSQSDSVSSIASVVGGPPPTSKPGFNISQILNATAASLTNNIRTASTASDRHMVNGTAYGAEIFYSINWRWTAAPVLLIVLTFVLLIWTVIDTRRKGLPVWGTSCLADLIHGLDATTRSTLVGLREVEILERSSENIQVFLRPADLTFTGVDTGPISGTASAFEFEERQASLHRPSQTYDTDQRYLG